MSDRMIAERLQPSLLDRLTDDDPFEVKESRDSRVIDLRQLREILQRDLAWLLNTSNNASFIDEDVYPNAFKSVVNYGISDVAGDYSTTERVELIRKSIVSAVQIFEPRIHPGSLNVKLQAGQKNRTAVVSFDIRADMWAQPLPIELYLRSSIDVTTGELQLERVA
ncbi:type VI secretion system baseplate subunit TssE [Tateyamaria sp.]|uniref:type VI secretion system baseplate subunit TssE n=1 Tax=Tateyamaria sp. TaxID=1929288 RepID=UPI00329C27EB